MFTQRARGAFAMPDREPIGPAVHRGRSTVRLSRIVNFVRWRSCGATPRRTRDSAKRRCAAVWAPSKKEEARLGTTYGGRVLIVDDDQMLARMISVRLRGAGFQAMTAHAAEEAAAMAVHERPDVIVVDVHMPHFSGLELHYCLQFAERSRDIPVVYLTAHDTESVRRAACELGAVAVITKPFESTKLIAAIKQAILSRRSPRSAGRPGASS